MLTADSDAIYDACRISDRLFVLHPEFRRNNFYSQQLRALALVEAMVRHGDLKETSRFAAVVGAGVAGLTAAAALLTVNANTVLVEKGDPLNTYRDAFHREVHPNLIFWPSTPLRSITDLPFLNWSCGTAPDVCRRIFDQWNRYFAKKVEHIKDEVIGFEETDSAILIHRKSDPDNPIRKDRVIVCTGFLKEKDAQSVGSPQYWGDPPVRQDIGSVTISGVGDGGLIDFAYQFYGMEAVTVSRVLAHCLKATQLEKEVDQVERDALDAANDGRFDDASKKLDNFYAKLDLSRADQETLRPYERSTAPHATLVYRRNTPYSPFTAPINKLLFAHCRKRFGRQITLKRGELTFPKPGAVELKTATGTEPLDPRATIIRHPPTAAAYDILSDKQKQSLDERKTNVELLNGVTKDEYDLDLFVKHAPRRLAPSVADDDKKTFHDDLETLLDALVAHTVKPLRRVEVRRDFVTWRVLGDGEVAACLEAHFPITVQSIKIEFAKYDVVESRRRPYKYNAEKAT